MLTHHRSQPLAGSHLLLLPNVNNSCKRGERKGNSLASSGGRWHRDAIWCLTWYDQPQPTLLDSCCRSVELYDIREDKWSRGNPMPHRESFAGCAAVGDQVALLGGGLHGRSMIVYSAATQSWQTAEAPHTPHLHCAVASMQSSLFVLVSCRCVCMWNCFCCSFVLHGLMCTAC